MGRKTQSTNQHQTVNGLLETKPQTSKALLIITHTVPYLSGRSDSDSTDVDLPGSILEISADFKYSHPTGSSSSFLAYLQQNTTHDTCDTISSLTEDQDSSPDSL